MMAIRILLDHDVPEENIILLSLLMAESGKEYYIILGSWFWAEIFKRPFRFV